MKYITFLTIFLQVQATIVRVKNCGPKDAVINSVDITPCEKQPCKLYKGTNVTMTINFKANTEQASLKAKVCGKIGPACVPFPLPKPDVCESIECPVPADSTNSYSITLPIQYSFPTMNVLGRINLVNENKVDFLCFYPRDNSKNENL